MPTKRNSFLLFLLLLLLPLSFLLLRFLVVLFHPFLRIAARLDRQRFAQMHNCRQLLFLLRFRKMVSFLVVIIIIVFFVVGGGSFKNGFFGFSFVQFAELLLDVCKILVGVVAGHLYYF